MCNQTPLPRICQDFPSNLQFYPFASEVFFFFKICHIAVWNYFANLGWWLLSWLSRLAWILDSIAVSVFVVILVGFNKYRIWDELVLWIPLQTVLGSVNKIQEWLQRLSSEHADSWRSHVGLVDHDDGDIGDGVYTYSLGWHGFLLRLVVSDLYLTPVFIFVFVLYVWWCK